MKNTAIRFATAGMCILFVSAFTISGFANAYYFASNGDDSRTSQEARNAQKPWRTISKLNAFLPQLLPGDTILFRRGDVFYGALNIINSGTTTLPIVFTAYGNGARPVISGFAELTGWVAVGNNSWEAPLPLTTTTNMVTVNGQFQAIGRYPNANTGNAGYLSYESYNGNTSITDQQLTNAIDWTGAEVVIRKTRWVLDRNINAVHSGNTITYVPASGYYGSNNFGYFFQNHPAALDLEGEWYYRQTAGKLGIFLSNGNPSQFNIQAAVCDEVITINQRSHLVIKNLSLSGSNVNTIRIKDAQDILIDSCELNFSGGDAANVSNTDGLTIRNCLVQRTNNNAFNIDGSQHILLQRNRISKTGMVAGMGKGDSGSYEAILMSGDHNSVEENVIDSTGYIPITFSGNDIVIKNNLIDHYTLVKDDGGGIYTWNNGSSPPVNWGRTIVGNIVLNGSGAPYGTDNTSARYAHGIYIDDNAGNVDITANTIAACASAGVYIHNAHDLVLTGNTSYNNGKQVVMEHDNIAASAPVYNVASKANIFFSKFKEQTVAEFKTKNNDLQNFGNFDSNYYCRPIDDNFTIYSLYRVNGTYYGSWHDLEGWKMVSGKDPASRRSPARIASYNLQALTGSNQFGNGNFNTNISGLYAYSGAGNSSVAWSSTSPLDGGALRITFNSQTSPFASASVIVGVGAVSSSKKYIVRFSMAGGDTTKTLEVFLRQSLSPYQDISSRSLQKASNGRKEIELLFSPPVSESNASLVFDVKEQTAPLYIDNIVVSEASANFVNPDDSLRFLYNASNSPVTYALNGSFLDAKGNAFFQSITLSPYASAVLIQKNTVLTVLPLKIISFEATRSGTAAQLKWKAEEDGADISYDVQRSLNGFSFVSIASLPGHTKASIFNYQYVDQIPATGKNYYRIVQRSAGKTIYSSVSILSFSNSSQKLGMSIDPDPVMNAAHLRTSKIVDGSASVISLSGNIIKTTVIHGNQLDIDLPGLTSGIYILHLRTKEGNIQQRFLKN